MSAEQKRTIQVQGHGKLSCKPDIVGISFRVSSKSDDYATAFNDLNKRVDVLRASIKKAGLDKTELKTTNFNISIENKLVKNNYVFDGYLAVHSLMIEIGIDKELLNTVLTLIAKSSSVSEFNLYYKVKDSTSYRDQVLINAVSQAKHNAEIISKASGASLGKILQITYGWSEIRFEQDTANMVCEEKCASISAPDIEPDDIKISESVTIVYEIID